ncbi:MAG TPA: ACP S-malonyltransferase [Fimbriimonadaceae bacterium]|nr:ACP S-malonyltransferase [Fimbriimonadaceae bacterium]
MVAAVFPGQGSQKPGMGRELFESEPHAAEVFARAGDALGFDVAALCFETDEDTLRQTENAQVALFTCGVAAFAALDREAAFGIAAGHSVGEYAALAAAGFLTVEDGARLVRRRGLLMAASGQARPGAMAAVLGLEREALEGVCQAASDVGVVVIANDNCPGQLVISGSVEGVARAGELASEAGAKRVLSLNVSGAFHSPLMTEAAAEMGAALREVEFRPGRMPVVANATAEPVTDPSAWPGLLELQMEAPVRWTESVLTMRTLGVNTFVECGAGDVLSGLLKRIDREADGLRVGDIESLASTRAVLDSR